MSDFKQYQNPYANPYAQNPYAQNLRHEQDSLALQYMPAVRAMAARIKERIPSYVDIKDLISSGMEELIKVARRYDPTIGEFWTYAKKRVNGAMIDYLRSLDTMSRANRTLLKRIDEEIENYYNVWQDEPSDEYLAKALGEPVEKVHEARVAAEIFIQVPIDSQVQALQEQDMAEQVEQEQLIRIIKEILEKLTKKEQTIMQLYYFEELTLEEISDIMDLTAARICQIQKSVIRKIRKELGIELEGEDRDRRGRKKNTDVSGTRGSGAKTRADSKADSKTIGESLSAVLERPKPPKSEA